MVRGFQIEERRGRVSSLIRRGAENLVKVVFDLIGVVVFFVVFYSTGDILKATVFAVVVSALKVGYSLIKFRRVESLDIMSFSLILVFASVSLVLQDPIFIMLKSTVFAGILALVLIVGRIFRKNWLQIILQGRIKLPAEKWSVLNHAWIVYFVFSGGLNWIIAVNCSERVWVNYKTFGGTGILIMFLLWQGFYLSRYVKMGEND